MVHVPLYKGVSSSHVIHSGSVPCFSLTWQSWLSTNKGLACPSVFTKMKPLPISFGFGAHFSEVSVCCYSIPVSPTQDCFVTNMWTSGPQITPQPGSQMGPRQGVCSAQWDTHTHGAFLRALTNSKTLIQKFIFSKEQFNTHLNCIRNQTTESCWQQSHRHKVATPQLVLEMLSQP